MRKAIRVGQIVPSSNTTMETEVPAMLRAREEVLPERFTFHSSRMPMKKVTREELLAMDDAAERCALELSDAKVDVIGYACLVAIMSRELGYHRTSEKSLAQVVARNDAVAPVITSAGALVDGLHALGAKRISLITPYMRPLARMVVAYIESEGFTVVDSLALGIEDNIEVGRRDPLALVELSDRVKTQGIDALVLSACVQMPSLAAIQQVEQRVGVPTISAASSTVFSILDALDLDCRVPKAGYLLSGEVKPARSLALT